MTKLEKIIKRADGTRIKLTADVYLINYWDLNWRVNVEYSEPGKRKFKPIYSQDDFTFRRLSMDERQEYIKTKQFIHVTEQEVLDVKLALWESIKPKA